MIAPSQKKVSPSAHMDIEKVSQTIEQEVMFFDTDCGGVVHNLAYLRMVEVCRTKLAGKLGMDLKSMADTQLFPVIVKTEAVYKKPAKLGDTLVIKGHFSGMSRARFSCDFMVYRKSDNALLLTAVQTLALVQMPEGRPVRLPTEWKITPVETP